MLMSEFIKGLRKSLASIKKSDGNETLSKTEIDESELTVSRLLKLIDEHANNHTPINSEKVLEPFTSFLANRWASLLAQHWAGINSLGSSYEKKSKTMATLYCSTLAENLIRVANTVKFKQRYPDDFLKPNIEVRMDVFAEAMLGMIKSVENKPEDHNPYVYLESQLAINNLTSLFEELRKTNDIITLESAANLLAHFKKRWELISNTDADYLFNKKAAANIIYTSVARSLFMALQVNKVNVSTVTPDRFLMERIDAKSVQSDSLRAVIFEALKNEDGLGNSSEKTWTNLLSSSNINSEIFAKRLLAELARLEENDESTLPLLAALEQRAAISKLKALLGACANSKDPITSKTLLPFIKFLNSRWNEIDGSCASYQAAPDTRINKFCHVLADHISLAGYQINYLNRDQERLLMRATHPGITSETANQQLASVVVGHCKIREDVINNMMSMDKSKWKEYIAYFDLQTLIDLMSNKKSDMNELLKINDYNDDEKRSKAILFCLLEIFIRDRKKINAPHTTYLGSVGSIFTRVPTLKDKSNAVEECQKDIISDNPLAGFVDRLNNEMSDLYPHKQTLENGKLKLFFAHIVQAIEKLPKKLEPMPTFPQVSNMRV